MVLPKTGACSPDSKSEMFQAVLRGPHRLRLVARNRGLRGRQPGDRDTVWRTGHIVHPHPVAEHHRTRLASMLSADADLQIRPGSAPQLDGVLDQLPDAALIENRERIVIEDLGLGVIALEFGVI